MRKIITEGNLNRIIAESIAKILYGSADTGMEWSWG